jgi:ankyrin repeat protein
VNPSNIKFTAIYTDDCGLMHAESGLLHAMVFRGFKKRAQYLIDQGIDMNQRDTYGNTALHIACKSSNGEMFKFLVMHGADTEAKNDKDEIPDKKPWW